MADLIPPLLTEHLSRLARMRETQPVWRDERTGIWHVYRYADVVPVLTDARHFGVAHAPVAAATAVAPPMPEAPRYPAIRSKLREALSAHMLAQMAPTIGEAANALLHPLLPAGKMEVMGALARPLAAAVLAELVGVPAADRARLVATLEAPGAGASGQSDYPATSSAPHGPAAPTAAEVSAYFAYLVADRRPDAQGDLISRLLAPGPAGERLGRDEVVAACWFLMTSGRTVLADMLGNAVLCLSESSPGDCSLLARLRHEPPPVYSTTEEALRFLPPVWSAQRTVRAAVALGGETLPVGAGVSTWIVAANRDPQQFPAPDRFDMDRVPNRHLTFGDGGTFACLGTGLARLVIRLTLALLAQRLSCIELTPEDGPEVAGLPDRCSLVRLPVMFAPRG